MSVCVYAYVCVYRNDNNDTYKSTPQQQLQLQIIGWLNSMHPGVVIVNN